MGLLQVKHSLTVIFFSRTFISSKSDKKEDYPRDLRKSAVVKDADGRLYEVYNSFLQLFFLKFFHVFTVNISLIISMFRIISKLLLKMKQKVIGNLLFP